MFGARRSRSRARTSATPGSQDRIEIREQPGEELPDERAFDLAWIPAPFVPPHALGRLVEQVQRALKPGGWLLFAAAKPGEDSRGAALRFRVALYGGAPEYAGGNREAARRERPHGSEDAAWPTA